MHAVVTDSLEAYLSGALEPVDCRKIEAHLGVCERCREAVAGMREVSLMFDALRPDEAPAPAPGFFARVMQEVGERKAAPSFSGLFSLDLAFGRRLVFASLLTLAVLGSYLVSRENSYSEAPSPGAVMAQQTSPMFDSASAQDSMLITLTAYERN